MSRGWATAVNEAHNALAPIKLGKSWYPGIWMPEKNQKLASAKRVALFHYVTKSLEDYKVKVARGAGNDVTHRKMPFFYHITK